MAFECQQCGECCTYLGQVFQILKELGDYSFSVRNQYTGEKQVVSVTPQWHHIFDNTDIFRERPEACPFFRHNPEDGLYYCTVHLTRPEICREYGCWRILIEDSRGNRAGRIMDRRFLHTESPLLRSIWDTQVSTLHEPDDRIWEEKVCRMLRNAGFTLRR